MVNINHMKAGRNAMVLGMSTLIELENMAQTAELCEGLGLDFIELNMNMPMFGPGALAMAELEATIEKGLNFTIHLDENLNIWDFNPLVSKAYMEMVLSAIAIAKKLHAPLLNMHMNEGVYFTLPDERIYLYDKYRDAYMKKTAQFKAECERAIEDSGILIAIENSDGFKGFQMEAIDCLLQSPVFGLTYDIGHDHSAGNADTEFIMRREQRLCHMHVHDAIGKKNHLPIGSGEINMREKLALAKAHGCRCVLETKTVKGLRESVLRIRELI